MEEDKDYEYLSWDKINQFIAADRLDLLLRSPSQVRLYAEWCEDIRQQYGSVANFVLQQRLHWQPITTSETADDRLKPPVFVVKNPTPYADKEDYRILINDWPYGFAAGIIHICVWLKTPLPSDAETGALSAEGTVMTDRFVQEHIAKPLDLPPEDIAWFKNPFALQSIRFVDHVHVLLKDVDRQKLAALLDTP